jgi:asparagine synthase (glutamine-hydrolysing)
MGFAVPLAGWFRGPLLERVRALIDGGRLADNGIFDQAALTRVVQQHESGLREHSAAIWSLLVFHVFVRRNAEGGARKLAQSSAA